MSSSALTYQPLTDRDYEYVRRLVYEMSRINLGPHKKELVTARLSKRLRALKLKSFTEYCHLLESPEGRSELTNLIDSISTNHTFFFREQAHFDFLSGAALPEFAQNRVNQIRLWSAACSSGEEPYSLAILFEERRAVHQMDWAITCTDISTKVLGKASEGIFAAERLGEMRRDFITKYFQKGFGEWEGFFRIRDELRQRMKFQLLNLCQPSYPWNQPFHLVFLRNVMIYFDRATQEEVVNRIFPHLVPGGYLIIGQSESLTGVTHPYRLIRPSIYRRPT